jgi:hypothetical protein
LEVVSLFYSSVVFKVVQTPNEAPPWHYRASSKRHILRCLGVEGLPRNVDDEEWTRPQGHGQALPVWNVDGEETTSDGEVTVVTERALLKDAGAQGVAR